MAQRVQPRVPRGMRDILPEKMILRQYVVGIIQEVFEAFGFEPLATPAVELMDTLMGKYGPEADKLLYHVGHEGGKEELGLRYDLSVPLCRVVAMYPQLIKPFKRYQIAPVWRAERPQKGRYREFWQCDADSVGSASMLADAEILSIIYEILTRLRFEKFITRLNNRKILKGIGQFSGVPKEQLDGLYRSIDKLEKIGLEGVKEELRKNGIAEEVIVRLLELLSIQGENRALLAEMRRLLAEFPIALEGLAELEEIMDYLEAVGLPESFIQIDFSMVRGLEYYTGPIYETVVEEPRIGSITGGGRYDELVGMFSGKNIPATGTTIGIERIIDVMDELKLFPAEVGRTVTEVLVTVFAPEMVKESLRLTQELRRAGLRAEIYFESDSLGRQIRYASQKGIPYAVILGPDELAAGKVSVRNLELGEQRTAERARLVEVIRGWGG
ncbi:MAG: histidine--tRNA ligase [Anaerolineae bacterium]